MSPRHAAPRSSVAQRVAEHVAVRVALRTFVERHFDAADHELAPFDQPMQIVADAGEVHPRGLFDKSIG